MYQGRKRTNFRRDRHSNQNSKKGGGRMTSREWVLIIAKEFNVSIRIAKMMYHSMIDTYLLKTNKSLYEPKGKVK